MSRPTASHSEWHVGWCEPSIKRPKAASTKVQASKGSYDRIVSVLSSSCIPLKALQVSSDIALQASQELGIQTSSCPAPHELISLAEAKTNVHVLSQNLWFDELSGYFVALSHLIFRRRFGMTMVDTLSQALTVLGVGEPVPDEGVQWKQCDGKQNQNKYALSCLGSAKFDPGSSWRSCFHEDMFSILFSTAIVNLSINQINSCHRGKSLEALHGT